MTRIVLEGDVDPSVALGLRDRLDRATRIARPHIEVDLSRVSRLHAAAVNALILCERRAKRAAGSLRVIPPSSDAATRTMAHVGLVGTGRS